MGSHHRDSCLVLLGDEASPQVLETERQRTKFEVDGCSVWGDRVRLQDCPTCKRREAVVLEVEVLKLALVVCEDILDHGIEALICEAIV